MRSMGKACFLFTLAIFPVTHTGLGAPGSARDSLAVATRIDSSVAQGLNPTLLGKWLNPCLVQYPKPKIEWVGSEHYEVNGQSWTRHRISVVNRHVYPNALFSAAPHLDPCGNNTNASRTWVNIYDGHGRYLYGFCALNSPESLDQLWFAVPHRQPPPKSIYITLEDRQCKTVYTSNRTSWNPCLVQYPEPKIEWVGSEHYEVNGQSWTRHRISVVNRHVYPSALFSAAPHLDPCGNNTNASRTWVNIYDGHGRYLYGFCALNSPESLGQLWFAVPHGQPSPKSIYITLEDRQCKTVYTSNRRSLGLFQIVEDRYEPDNSFDRATPFDVGQTQFHTLHESLDQDWVKVKLFEHTVYRLETFTPPALESSDRRAPVVIEVYIKRQDGTPELIARSEHSGFVPPTGGGGETVIPALGGGKMMLRPSLVLGHEGRKQHTKPLEGRVTLKFRPPVAGDYFVRIRQKTADFHRDNAPDSRVLLSRSGDVSESSITEEEEREEEETAAVLLTISQDGSDASLIVYTLYVGSPDMPEGAYATLDWLDPYGETIPVGNYRFYDDYIMTITGLEPGWYRCEAPAMLEYDPLRNPELPPCGGG